MAREVFTVTGQGVQPFTAAFLTGYVNIAVTPGGPAHPIDASDPARWMDIGWWALYEDIAGNPDIPDGRYLLRIRFIGAQFEIVDLDNVNDQFDWSGVNGFRYFLMPGNSAVFSFFY